MFIFVRRADNILLRVWSIVLISIFPLEKPTQNILSLEVKNLKNILIFLKKKIIKFL